MTTEIPQIQAEMREWARETLNQLDLTRAERLIASWSDACNGIQPPLNRRMRKEFKRMFTDPNVVHVHCDVCGKTEAHMGPPPMVGEALFAQGWRVKDGKMVCSSACEALVGKSSHGEVIPVQSKLIWPMLPSGTESLTRHNGEEPQSTPLIHGEPWINPDGSRDEG